MALIIWPWVDMAWQPTVFTVQTNKWKKRFENFDHGFLSFDISGYKLLLKQAGFDLQYAEQICLDTRLENLDMYARIIGSWSPYLAHLTDEEERQELLTDICHKFSEMAGKDQDGSYYCPTRYLNIIAEKK